MQFKPKTEAELNADQLQPGIAYDFDVIEAQEAVSKKGNDMIALTIGVYTQTGRQMHYKDWLVEAMAFKLRHFCQAVGMLDHYEAGTLSAANLVGRSGKVVLKIESQQGYKDRLVVKDYEGNKPSSGGVPQENAPAPRRPAVPPAGGGAGADDPPFARADWLWVL